jgi:hypothetical protein
MVLSNKIECRIKPETLLVDKPEKLVRKKGKGYKKETKPYLQIEKRLSKLWPIVREKCSEAERFSFDFLAVSIH